jgi:hypothetical protein
MMSEGEVPKSFFFKYFLWGDFLGSGVIGKVLQPGTLVYIGILVKAYFSCRKFGFKVRNRHFRNNEPRGGAEILFFKYLSCGDRCRGDVHSPSGSARIRLLKKTQPHFRMG